MNTTYYANKHFDELIDKALVEPNEAKRNQLYEDAQKTAWEDAPWAFLLFEMSTGASNKHLKNFNMMVDQSFEFYNAEWVEITHLCARSAKCNCSPHFFFSHAALAVSDNQRARRGS